MSLVNVTIVGNLVRDPEVFAREHMQKATITVAVSSAGSQRREDGKFETEFYKVEAWGKLAEIAVKFLKKGSHVGVSGRLVLDKWQDKTGRDRVTPTVKADQISLPPKLQVVHAPEAVSAKAVPPAEQELTFAPDGGSEDEYDELLGFTHASEILGQTIAEPIPIYRVRQRRTRQLVGS
jgi:single-strand DNA-binding protein